MIQDADGLRPKTKEPRKREFLMSCWLPKVVPMRVFTLGCPQGATGRSLSATVSMARVHCLQKWFELLGREMKEALHDLP